MPRLNHLATIAALALAAACTTSVDEPPATENLDRIEIPKDFAFVTKKPVALTVRASADAVERGAALEITREDGRRLYMGAIRPDRDVQLKLTVPSKDESVRVNLLSNDTTRSAKVMIGSGEGTAEFE